MSCRLAGLDGTVVKRVGHGTFRYAEPGGSDAQLETGKVVGIKQVREEDGMMLITQEGMIIRLNVADVRQIGRSTQGVKLMDLDGTDKLVAMAKIVEKDNGEAEPEPEIGGEPVN